MDRRNPDQAPELNNREQDDEGQNLGADPAQRGAEELDETQRGNPVDPAELIPDDVPDLVETMDAMVRSGHIDNNAYSGEPVHDDEEDILGDTGEDREDI